MSVRALLLLGFTLPLAFLSLRLTLIFRGVSVAEVGSALPVQGNPSQKLPKLSPVLVVNVFIASVGARVEREASSCQRER